MEKNISKSNADKIKAITQAPSVQEQFKNILKQNSGAFIASIIDLYNSDSQLSQCEPKEVVMEALKAASLNLPINKGLGQAWLIPYNCKKPDGGWRKRPQFQIGYKGLIQLAMRTGQYKTINADIVYEGELQQVDKLTGFIKFDGEKKSEKVIGYFCYFELLNGFSKTLYMDKESMANHAIMYSKGLPRGTTSQTLLDRSNVPATAQVGWLGNFNEMAIKTVITRLLSKYGYLSVQMQNAIISEQSSTLEDDQQHNKVKELMPTEFEEVKETKETEIVDPETGEVQPAITEAKQEEIPY